MSDRRSLLPTLPQMWATVYRGPQPPDPLLLRWKALPGRLTLHFVPKRARRSYCGFPVEGMKAIRVGRGCSRCCNVINAHVRRVVQERAAA